MLKQVLFRDRQEVQSVDLNGTGDFAKLTIDALVKDGIEDGKGWCDFVVFNSGVVEVTVSPGRIYVAGAGYVAETDTVFDLLGELPIANTKWVGIVAYGSQIDTDVQPRDKLIDADLGSTEASAVPMQRLRKCNIATVVGVEAPQPALPAIAAENIILAWVLLNTTGVAAVTLVEANRLPQVAREKARTDELAAWRALIGPRVDSLASDLAKLVGLLSQVGHAAMVESLAVDVARLKAIAELEDAYTSYGADRFLDTSESNMVDVNTLVKVEEGVRFSDAAANLTNIDVFNPLNPDVVISASGFLLPKYTEVKRFQVGPFFEPHSISQYQFQTHTMVQRTVARERIRYGEDVTVCTNAAFWKSGTYDPVSHIFNKGGDTWTLISGNPAGKHNAVRLRRYWIDTYAEYYWDRIVIGHAIDGQQIGQTFLNPQDGWLTSVGLYFTAKSVTGNVSVALCAVSKSGTPDLEAVISISTLNVANILTSANGTIETKVAIPATFVEAGKRYAIVLTTGGNHYVAMAQGSAYAQGTFFYSLDGAYQQGVAEKDMMFGLYYASFAKPRTVVDLEVLSLSGGIASIDIMAPLIKPASTDLTFEVQVAGVWTPLAEVENGNTVLFGLPPLLPFRAVFVGTTDVQPGINIAEAVLGYSRPRTTFKHISSTYTMPSTQIFKVIATLENYYETNHNLTCTIQKNATGAAIAPATITDQILDPPLDATDVNHLRIKRTFSWTATQITTGMTSTIITMDGGTSSALDVFHVAERVHLAF